MPARVIPLGGGRYKVVTPKNVHAKSTTKQKAQAQQRLLNAIEHNPKFVPYKKKSSI